MPLIEVFVAGVDSASVMVMVEAEHITARAIAKLRSGAELVAATARANMLEHRWHGQTISAIKVSGPRIYSKYFDEGSKGVVAQELSDPSWVRQMRVPAGQPGGGRFMSFDFSAVIPKFVTFTVGIDHSDVPPFFVGSTFEHGWVSSSGKQPPTEPLAEWALSRGIASSAKDAEHIGFAIARKIGRDGYKFGTFPWLSEAFNMNKDALAASSSGFLR
jgi:hypothetical protein